MRMRRADAGLVSLLGLAALIACRTSPPAQPPEASATVLAEPLAAVQVSGLVAGAGEARPHDHEHPYLEDAEALAEGRSLFLAFNCAGCHGADGGGGIGPPFADSEWIYGGSVENIYATIIQGRPNGMPAFGERMTGDPVWRIAAFVASLDQGRGKRSGGGAPGEAQGRTEAGTGRGEGSGG
jgi:cytochrome c oxidase cbb3-type subunit 3